MRNMTDEQRKVLAKTIALQCVRNTYLEELHCGTTPSSKARDFSDVKVVTPFGEIPWQDVSRISDKEMKKLMKEVVNRIYAFLTIIAENQENLPLLIEAMEPLTSHYDDPVLNTKTANFKLPI